MTPGVFSLENALEIVDDAKRRVLGAEARAAAESGAPPRDFEPGTTYWESVVREMERIVWMDAYDRRRARIERLRTKG